MDTKICSKCKIEKLVEEFTKNKSQNDGLKLWCKQCCYESHLMYMKNGGKEKVLENSRTIKSRKYQKTYRDNIKNNHYERLLLKSCKDRAKRNGLDFNLELCDIIIPALCPVLKKELVVGDIWWKPTVDRIDSSKGYIKGNIQVLSMRANFIKTNATPEEIRMLNNYVNGMK